MNSRRYWSRSSHTLSQATHKLFGVKWFSSATDCDMALTLARDGPDSRALSMFYVRLRDASGQLNGIEILRMKNKVTIEF